MNKSTETDLSRERWFPRMQAHHKRVQAWIEPRLARRGRGQRHPVDDFLFEYYPQSPAKLTQWHAGYPLTLLEVPNGVADIYAASADYLVDRETSRVRVNPTRFERRRKQILRSILILTAAADRAPRFSCFGMHEWAMVYDVSPAQIRHNKEPLRLSREAIKETVDAVGLSCTHFDAYRFFTPAATQKQVALNPDDQLHSEQPGCLHFGMDLYRHAYQAGPFLPSELTADCFAYARRARDLDMRASPYDLQAYGLDPIPLESVAGQTQYVQEQRAIATAASGLRSRTLTALQGLLGRFES
jgi:hypothetical protein